MNSRNNIAIQLTNVSKTYVIHHMPGRHTDTRRDSRREKRETFMVLDNVSLII